MAFFASSTEGDAQFCAAFMGHVPRLIYRGPVRPSVRYKRLALQSEVLRPPSTSPQTPGLRVKGPAAPSAMLSINANTWGRYRYTELTNGNTIVSNLG